MRGMDRWLEGLLRDVRAGQPADLAGTRIEARVAVTDDLLNRVLQEKLPPGAAVKEVRVTIDAHGGRVSVRLAKPSFLPALNVRVTIERQPEFPAAPVLVLRIDMPPGVAAIAGAALSFLKSLPAGHRLEGDRLHVDIPAVLRERGYAWVLPYVRGVRVTLEPGRLVHNLELSA